MALRTLVTFASQLEPLQANRVGWSNERAVDVITRLYDAAQSEPKAQSSNVAPSASELSRARSLLESACGIVYGTLGAAIVRDDVVRLRRDERVDGAFWLCTVLFAIVTNDDEFADVVLVN